MAGSSVTDIANNFDDGSQWNKNRQEIQHTCEGDQTLNVTISKEVNCGGKTIVTGRELDLSVARLAAKMCSTTKGKRLSAKHEKCQLCYQ